MDKFKDNILLGVFIGVLVPIFFYKFLLTFLEYSLGENPLRESTMHVIAIFLNFPVIRIFLIKYQKDNIGRGILLSTFIIAIWYIIHHNMLVF